MAFFTVVAQAQPTQPWRHAYTVRARVSAPTATRAAVVALPSVVFLGDGRAAPVKGLGLVGAHSARLCFVRASGAASAAHPFGVASGCSAPGDLPSFVLGASATAAAGHALAALGVSAGPSAPRGLHGSHHPPPSRLAVACSAGRSNPNTDDDQMSWDSFYYWTSVERFEEGFRPAALFNDKDLAMQFKEIAERGAKYIDNAIISKGDEIMPFGLNLEDLTTSAKSFRRLSLEADKGYVLASSVVEATNGFVKVMRLLIPDRTNPPYPSVVPYVVHKEEIGEYFRTILGGFRALLDAAESQA